MNRTVSVSLLIRPVLVLLGDKYTCKHFTTAQSLIIPHLPCPANTLSRLSTESFKVSVDKYAFAYAIV